VNVAIQYVKASAVLLALVAIALFQQSEIKEMERTLNYIYSVVQTSERKIQATQEDVWAVSDLIVAVYEEEQGEQ
tara:strand:+ start:137 stop:361 length:225 start_codon:yes stop_codon:yes gene_type:complete